ncbi:MAG: D-alanine--D-alanine ligase [Candidatus Moranbacteria bacterium]|nr:D-alanine--D-alanine ligase [Candidatus Moranbacteria bacterium]
MKIKLAIIFGGKSAEHEVSIKSARNIIQASDKKKYELIILGVSKAGEWFQFEEADMLSSRNVFASKRKKAVTVHAEKNGMVVQSNSKKTKIEVVFPIIHGTFGEDGTLQGMLKAYGVPFVGPSILGSAVGMDKDVAKRLMREVGIPVSKFLVYRKKQASELSFEKIKKALGIPFFVKPANLGSSVGISKVKNKNDFGQAIKDAFAYDNKIIIEEAVMGKEIECSVMGNENPMASALGEIIPSHDFYSYKAKYLDKKGATTAIPANIPPEVAKKIQALAIQTFEVLCCEGMGRVDFFLTKNNKIFVNEINTIPGFTSVSMYPKLWEHSGVTYAELIDRLIGFAIERHKMENKLRISK